MLSFGKLARRIFGTANDRRLHAARALVAGINELEPRFRESSDAAFRDRTAALRSRVLQGESLDVLLPEAFANCREAARRSIGLRAFDVQLLGGIFLHQGKIAEMLTGEGKTLAATLPAYLNALSGKGIHVVTVNDYLARRDAETMGRVYSFLGLTTGVVSPGLSAAEKRAAYRADVTYATHSELGFDYLRDNMRSSLADMVQCGHTFAIVDEADSIFIDEARTPLIISGPSCDHSPIYRAVDEIVARVMPEHFSLDSAARWVIYTEEGNNFIEGELAVTGLLGQGKSLYDRENVVLVNHVVQALRARHLFHRDQHYVVRDGRAVLVDQFTGRTMPDRRFSDGLHQAIEAKEGIAIRPENSSLSSVTYQNFFRLYGKLSGMTGTAATDAEEFLETYGLEVVQIPPNRAVRRTDEPDRIFCNLEEKYLAVVGAVRDANQRGQPVLVGTTSIEKSEKISKMLREAGISHNLLNANHHEREAAFIADAGRLGAVTIATNMAGRGTDIQLGGNAGMTYLRSRAANPEIDPNELREQIDREHRNEKTAVISAGGLYVLGTERHESRRIDNQLRGRAGRQGDPGMTCFFLSPEDDLLHSFGPESLEQAFSKHDRVFDPFRFEAEVGYAQARAQSRHFEIRKRLLSFDNVVNDQRKVVFDLRMRILQSIDLDSMVQDMRHHVISDFVDAYLQANVHDSQWDIHGLALSCENQLALDLPISEWASKENSDREAIRERIVLAADAMMERKANSLGQETMANFEKQILLKTLDRSWREHQWHLEQLQSSIGLRAYALRNPLLEFKTDAFACFEDLIRRFREEVTTKLAQIQPMDGNSQIRLMTEIVAQKPANLGT